MMKTTHARITLLFLIVLSGLCIACAPKQSAPPPPDWLRSPRDAKNVILFIGDGMALPQVQTAVFSQSGQHLDENGQPAKMSFEHFPVVGYSTNFSLDSLVTDSAAAGTALATGHKTNNGFVSMLPDGTNVPTIAELARDKGKAVGIVTSVALNHGTPAPFYAHVFHRGEYDLILEDCFTLRTPDVLLGGGMYKKKLDEAQIHQKAREAGYQVFTCENFDSLTADEVRGSKVFGYFDLNDNKMLDYANQRKPDNKEPLLDDLTMKALDILVEDPDGFFLMVEGGSIDWACHGNKLEETNAEMYEFDRAIEKTVEFLKRTGQLDRTLIIVTGDHETGGLAITGPYDKPLIPGVAPAVKWGSGNHTALPPLVWSQGPGAHLLGGKYDQTHIFNVMALTLE